MRKTSGIKYFVLIVLVPLSSSWADFSDDDGCKDYAERMLPLVQSERRDVNGKLYMINDIIHTLKTYCGKNGALPKKYTGKKSELVGLIQSKSGVAVESVEAKVALVNSALVTALNRIESDILNINSQKIQITNLISKIPIKVGRVVSEYQSYINSFVERVDSASSYSDLASLEMELQYEYIELSRELNEFRNEINLAIIRAGLAQDRIQESLASISYLSKTLEMPADVRIRSKYVNDALFYIKQTDESGYSIMQDVLDFLNQKLLAARYNELDSANKEQYRIAQQLDKTNLFLLEANDIVTGFRKSNTSEFKNMRYLTENLSYSRKLIEMANACSVGDVPEWQKLGCNRVNTYKSNANSFLNSTAYFSMKFVIRLLADSENERIQMKVSELQKLIDAKRLDEAVYLQDAILVELSRGDF